MTIFLRLLALVAAFGARVEVIFAHILVFPACPIEVLHINENSPTVLTSITLTNKQRNREENFRILELVAEKKT